MTGLSDGDARTAADEDDPPTGAEKAPPTDDEHALGPIADWDPAEDWSDQADATG